MHFRQLVLAEVTCVLVAVTSWAATGNTLIAGQNADHNAATCVMVTANQCRFLAMDAGPHSDRVCSFCGASAVLVLPLPAMHQSTMRASQTLGQNAASKEGSRTV